jgi:hypothetical protein
VLVELTDQITEYDRAVAGHTLRSDRHLEFLGGAKRDLFARLDVDLLTGCRIAAHAGGSIPYLQNSKAGDLHPLRPFSNVW